MININKIESLAAVDGPGVRYGVFLQGCPLRCAYCHNPETQSFKGGRQLSEKDLLKQILRYKPYFNSKGGVTFSGGEPLSQAKELLPLIKMLKKEDINVAIDTSGSVLNQNILEILALKPLIILDIKMLNNKQYNEYIGTSLDTVLTFLEKTKEYNCDVWISFVALEDVNTSNQDIKLLSDIVNEYENIKRVQVLPYHTLGVDKYTQLGIEYKLKNQKVTTDITVQKIRNTLHNLIKKDIIIK